MTTEPSAAANGYTMLHLGTELGGAGGMAPGTNGGTIGLASRVRSSYDRST